MNVIHLFECEPEEHPDWKPLEFRARPDDAEPCPDTVYMWQELYPDEPVWLEEKP